MKCKLRPVWGIPLLFALVCCGACSASGSIVYVYKNAAGTVHDGRSWTTAFTSIQPGLSVAKLGDEVWVAAGTYPEHVEGVQGIPLYGGFVGTETTRDQRDWSSHVTILGGGSHDAVATKFAGVALDGFTLRNAVNGVYVYGGAVSISNCVISGNGVGVFVDNGTATIASCVICGNSREGVSGVAKVRNCTISENAVGVNGWSTVTNTVIAFNGTGIKWSGPKPVTVFSHNDVYGNAFADYTGDDDQTGINGNISRDPMLSNAYHDVHLQPGSPCVDAGDDSAIAAGETDVYGKPRIIGAHVDIGADESDGRAWSILPRVWYVTQAGSDSADGLSWNTAKKTIGAAFAIAEGTDEVWVARGTYQEAVSISAGVSAYGGFTGTETSRGQRNWSTNLTSIDGTGLKNVTLVNLKFAGAVLDGFGLRNTIIGIGVSGGPATITHCDITAASIGVKMDNGGDKTTITNCTIHGNTVGVETSCGVLDVVNCTISGNSTGVDIACGDATITNTIVAYNGTGISGPDAPDFVTLSHNDVFGNAFTDYKGLPDPTGTAGNLSQDPLLSNAFHDIHIQPGSPCIDTGDDPVVSPGQADGYGKPRIIGAHVDIGADESDGTTWTVISRIWYVSSTGGDANDGSSWERAKRTVAGAVSTAQGTDEVWITEGIYTENVSLPAGLALYGGFAGSETLRSQRRWTSNVTVLDGNCKSAVKIMLPGAVLDGFTVRHGGDAIDVIGGAVAINNCEITGNSSGVVVDDTGAASIGNSIFSGNTADGIKNSGLTTVVNSTLSGNGAGISTDGGTARIANTVIAFNGTGFNRVCGGVVALSHNDVYRNEAGDYTGIANATGTHGNIGLDPKLSNPYHDIHLQPVSPCIDAGDDSVISTGETDAYGNPRIFGAHVDIGADESEGTTWSIPSRIWHVSRSGRDSNDGTSWSRAIGTIGFALRLAQGTDEVWVAKGIYPENVSLKPGVLLYGGFAGTESYRNERDWTANPTALDGSGDTKSSVVTSSAQGAVLDGLIVQNGGVGVSITAGTAMISNCAVNGNTSTGVDAAGISATVTNCNIAGNHLGIDSGYGVLTLTNCSIRGNAFEGVRATGRFNADGCTVSGNSSGIYVASGAAMISNSTFSGNGSGVYVRAGDPDVINCILSENTNGVYVDVSASPVICGCSFSRNTFGVYVNLYSSAVVSQCDIAGSSFNGVYALSGSEANITRCTIRGNSTGVYVYGGSATISDCVISRNSTQGIYVWGQTTASNSTICDNDICGVFGAAGGATLTNCILAYNGSGVYLNDGDLDVEVSHTDAYGNSFGDYINLADPSGTGGNIEADPMFVDRTTFDYHLKPESPCIDNGDDSVVTAGETDLDGRPRIARAHVDMGAYEATLPWSASLGTTVSGGVTVADGVAYVSGYDGNLYARSTTDGSAVAGFPVDINAAVGATVKLPSRPAVYYGKTGKAIYLTTDRGDVVRVLPDGTVAWHVRPLAGQTVSTPAVTPDGYVFVNLSTGAGPFDNFVFKLDEATGTPLSLSPFLGYTTADNIGDFSPAANSRYLYVDSGWGSKSGLTLLNQDNLAVRSSFAGGEQCPSPLLLGSDLLLASKSGKAWKMNAVTLAPDLGFGHFGVADLGTQITAAPFSDAAGNVYIGTADGKILNWAPGSGAFQPFYTTTGKIAGLTIDRTAGVLGFGTSNGNFVQVPLSDPTSATTVTPGGPISTGTVYEALTDRFVVVTDSGVLSGYPSMR